MPVISDARYDALLGKLYAGASDRRCLSEFMGDLGRATASHITTLVRADLANPSASSLLAVGAGPEELFRWSEHAGENPWMQRYRPEIHPGGVCNGDAYVTRKELLASSYYDGFLRHIDTQHSVGICAAYDANRAAFLMMCRPGRVGAYDDDCIRLFERLAPHVVNAFELQMQFEQLNAQASVSMGRRGMFLLDAKWRWVGGNQVAEQMVMMGWWRGRPKSRLEAAHAISRAAWQRVQRQFGEATCTQKVIPVHDANGCLVAFASAHLSGSSIAEDAPCYLLFVRPLQSVDMDAVQEQLRQLYGLTVSEAAFALALRKHGHGPSAAAAVGIAESSARTRLQSILGKIGVHRQADLMLLMDALAETVA
jgi:hypothetical protein